MLATAKITAVPVRVVSTSGAEALEGYAHGT
jgi:hypothetical protein